MRTLWAWWMRVAKRIGDFQARMLMVLFYFLVLGPFALVVRWAFDPLANKSRTRTGWLDRSAVGGSHAERARRQF